MGKRKTAAAWRAFLWELARSGNARLAAREAGMDVGTAYDRRIRDDAFAGKWAAALETFRKREAKKRPSPRSCSARGRGREELVLRRTKHGDKLVRAAAGRWCAEMEAAFFVALGRTGCVRASARAAGISTNALYKRREAYPEFAERWARVEAAAAARLPALLRAASIASLDPEAAEETAGDGLPPINVDQAIRISKMTAGKGAAAGPDRRTATREETEAAVLKLLAKQRRRVQSEKLAEGWSEAADGTLVPPGWVHAGPPPDGDAEPGDSGD